MTEEYIDKLVHQCRKYKLEGWETVQEYTVAGLAAVYNGAGPDSWSPAMRSLTTQACRLFQPAVLVHDVQFSRSNATQAGFDEAVRCWVANCRMILDTEYPLWTWKMLNPAYRAQRLRWFVVMGGMSVAIQTQDALQAWQAAAATSKGKINR